jgi:hypothetical protein
MLNFVEAFGAQECVNDVLGRPAEGGPFAIRILVVSSGPSWTTAFARPSRRPAAHVEDRAPRNPRRVWIDNMNATSYATTVRKMSKGTLVPWAVAPAAGSVARGRHKPPWSALRPDRRLLRVPHICGACVGALRRRVLTAPRSLWGARLIPGGETTTLKSPSGG